MTICTINVCYLCSTFQNLSTTALIQPSYTVLSATTGRASFVNSWVKQTGEAQKNRRTEYMQRPCMDAWLSKSVLHPLHILRSFPLPVANLGIAGQYRQKESLNRVLSLSMSEFCVLAITLPSKSIHQPVVLPSYTVFPDTYGQHWQFLYESCRYRLERITEQSLCTISARSSCISGHFQNLSATCFPDTHIPFRYLWLICAYQAGIGKKNRWTEYSHRWGSNFKLWQSCYLQNRSTSCSSWSLSCRPTHFFRPPTTNLVNYCAISACSSCSSHRFPNLSSTCLSLHILCSFPFPLANLCISAGYRQKESSNRVLSPYTS